MRPKKIYLASNSPRRQELLRQAGIRFQVKVAHEQEIFPDSLQVYAVPEFLASYKAHEVKKTLEHDSIVIAADTVVIVDNTILGKPSNESDAFEMLGQLSGKTHDVLTGVCIIGSTEICLFTDTTQVTFRKLDHNKMAKYVNSFKPYDKAGAYAIQEWIGLVGIKRISGDYFNVMGLPIGRVLEMLESLEGPLDSW